MSDFVSASGDFNATEKSWLSDVFAALQNRGDNGPISLAELGVLCPRSKNMKAKCRKVSVLLSGDSRFTMLDGERVELRDQSATGSEGDDSKTDSVDSTPHASFLLYMSALPEEDVVDSEMHHHLERHYTIWKLSEDGQKHAGIEELHLTEVIDSLKDDNKVHVHPETSRLVLETYAGRIEARMAALSRRSSGEPLNGAARNLGDIIRETPGAYTNITGTNYKNVKFLDFTEFELGMFGDTGVDHGYVVRGPNYQDDKEKLNTGPALFRLVAAEIIAVDGAARYDNIGSMGRVKQRVDALLSIEEPPEIFIGNYQYPGTPPVNNVAIYVGPPDINTILPTDSHETKAYKNVWARFKKSICMTNAERLKVFEACRKKSSWGEWFSDITWGTPDQPGVYPKESYANQRFKLIPTILEGNFIVRAAMPAAVPCLLGQKVQQRYFRGEGYVEVDVDVGSSAIASNIISVLRSFAKHVKAQYGITIQGEEPDELPERLFFSQSANNLDYEHLNKIGTLAGTPTNKCSKKSSR